MFMRGRWNLIMERGEMWAGLGLTFAPAFELFFFFFGVIETFFFFSFYLNCVSFS